MRSHGLKYFSTAFDRRTRSFAYLRMFMLSTISPFA
jgi:hypothetical protein